MPLLAVYTALMLVTHFAEDLAVIERRAVTAGVVVFLAEAIRAGMLIGAVLTWNTLEAIAWASVAYGLLRVVYVTSHATYLYGRSLLQVTRQLFVAQLWYSVPFGIAVIVETAQVYLHQYFVAGVSNPATFAIYAIGCFQLPVAHIVYAAIADVALVRTTTYYRVGDVGGGRRLYKTVVRVLSAFFIPAYVFMVTFATLIVSVLFTASYLAAVPVLIVFSLMLLAFPFADHVVLRAHDQTRFILLANVGGLAVNAILLVPMYRAFGITGAAGSYVVGLLTVRIAGLLRVSSLLGESGWVLLPLRSMAVSFLYAGLSAAAAAVAVRSLLGLPALLLGGLVFGGVYMALAWYGRLLTEGEKARVIGYLHGLRQRLW
jgi:O-antigen/teichoic acid export membrane protein